MTLKRALFGIVVLAVAGAFVAGYWPEHQRLVAARTEVVDLGARLADAEAKNRLSDILGLLLRLQDSVDERNFGDATQRATVYFDRSATEAQAVVRPELKASLEQVVRGRDRVVAALAVNDAVLVSEELRAHELVLRRALGFPAP